MSEDRIYLDCNATTPLCAAARARMQSVLEETGNPSSVHAEGRHARATLEAARSDVASSVGASSARVIFTSGATEANALALRGTPAATRLVSAVEHDSVRRNAPEAVVIPVDAEGVVRLDALEELLEQSAKPTLVSVLWANNETGVLQPVAEVARLVAAAGGVFHCDAVQALGRVPVGMAGIDLLTLSSHKIGGPMGAGALLVSPCLTLAPLYQGGGQEKGVRPGTENVPALAGFGVAAAEAARLEKVPEWARWQADLEQAVLQALPEARVVGRGAPRLANTVCLLHPRLSAEMQLMKLDLAGFAVSSGSACSSGRIKASHVLQAMQLSEKEQNSAIRVSWGPANKPEDLQRFVAFWTQM